MYEWDEAKCEANRAKHGVGFEVVEDFDWSSAVIGADERYDYGEVRARAFGRIAGVAHCIAFTRRGQALRIISLRHMHEKEIRRYGI